MYHGLLECRNCGDRIQQGKYCRKPECVRARKISQRPPKKPKDGITLAKKAFQSHPPVNARQRDWGNQNRPLLTPEQREKMREYLQDANEVAAAMERSRIC